MADEQQPIGVEAFLVPAEEQQGEPPEVGGETDEVEQLPSEEPEPEEEVPDEEAEPEAEEADEEESEVEAVPMPTSWSKDDAEAWKALPAETQAVIVRREGERDKYVREVGRKAAETRHTVENEAREHIARQAEDYAIRLQAYAAQSLPQPPSEHLLYSGNPDDVLTYQRQEAAYQRGLAQHQAVQQD